MSRRANSSHICLAARANSTIEHLQSLALQATTGRPRGLLARPRTRGRHRGSDPGLRPFRRHPFLGAGSAGTRTALRRDAQDRWAWIQTPYPEHYPDWFWSAVEPWPLCFAQYSIQMMTWEHGLYGLNTYKQCRWILVESSVAPQRLSRGPDPRGPESYLAGNPTLYELRHGDRSPVGATNHDLLWAPHWSQDWFGQRGFSRWREWPRCPRWAGRNPRVRWRCDHIRSSTRCWKRRARRCRRIRIPGPAHTSERWTLRPIHGGRCAAEPLAAVRRKLSDSGLFATTGKPLGLIHDHESPDFCELGYAILGCSDVLSTPGAISAWLDDLPEAVPSAKRAYVANQLLPDFAESPIAMWNRVRISAGGDRPPGRGAGHSATDGAAR